MISLGPGVQGHTKKVRRLEASTDLDKKGSPLPVLIEAQATGPVPTARADGPAIPPRMRRHPLTFATLSRRAERRATWISADRQGELSPLEMLTTIVAAVVLAVALGAWTVLL